MTTVYLGGRKLPHQDFEGDDFVPNARGWVTCTDTALGVDVAFATNGRIVKDGKTYRASIHPHDVDGITLPQAHDAARIVAGCDLIIPGNWDWAHVLAHLTAKKGLIVQGWYSFIPRMYRFQFAADFGHAMFISHFSTTSGMRVWDPLDANLSHHGQWIPAKYIRAYMEELSRRNNVKPLYCGFVPLQPLKLAA
jgi:hypothetical protein